MVGVIYTLVCDALPKRFALRSTEVFAQPPGLWSLALPAASPSPWVWQKSRPFDGPFERECLQRFTEFDAATLPTRRIMRLAIPPSEEVSRGSGL